MLLLFKICSGFGPSANSTACSDAEAAEHRYSREGAWVVPGISTNQSIPGVLAPVGAASSA